MSIKQCYESGRFGKKGIADFVWTKRWSQKGKCLKFYRMFASYWRHLKQAFATVHPSWVLDINFIYTHSNKFCPWLPKHILCSWLGIISEQFYKWWKRKGFVYYFLWPWTHEFITYNILFVFIPLMWIITWSNFA